MRERERGCTLDELTVGEEIGKEIITQNNERNWKIKGGRENYIF